MTDFRIRVVVDPTQAEAGLSRVDRGLKRADDGAKRLQSTISRLFGILASAAAVRGVVQLADSFTNLQNRLRVVTQSEAELVVVTDKLFESANRTRSSFENTVEVYSRTALAAKNLGRSQQELIDFTTSLNQAIILSGATAKEANNGLIQLSQGLGSGTLRGDELRAVLEQLNVVADVIAKQMGVTRNEIRLLGQEGKISADVILDAFKNARQELDERFARTIPTLAQSFTVLRNNVIRLIGETDKSVGITRTLSVAILSFASNIETVARVVTFFVTILGVRGLVGAIRQSVQALKLLRVALLANPIGLLITLLGVVIGLFVAFGDEIKLTAGGFADIQDLAIVAFDTLKQAVSGAVEFFKNTFPGISETVEDIFGDIDFSVAGLLRALARISDGIIGVIRGSIRALVIAIDIGVDEGIALLTAFGNTATRVGASLGDFFRALSQSIRFALQGKFEESLNLAGLAQQIAKEEIPAQLSFEQFDKDLQEQLDKIPDLGAAVAEAFKQGFGEAVGAQDLVERLLQQAEDRAQQRETTTRDEKRAREAAEQGLGVAPERAQVEPAGFQEALRALQQEQFLLRSVTQERLLLGQQLKIEQDLRQKGVTLSEDQQEQLAAEIRRTQQLREEVEIIEELIGPTEELARKREALARASERAAGGTAVLEKASRDLRIQELELSQNAADGVERAFLKIQKSGENLAQGLEQVTVGAVNGLSDAIADLALTGEANFSELVDSIIRDLIKLLAQAALAKLIKVLTEDSGGGGGIISGVLGILNASQAAKGATNTRAGETFIVGEEGPELFRTPARGDIIPARETEQMLSNAAAGGGAQTVAVPAPQVSVNVVNITDPNEALTAMDSPKGDKLIVNAITRNRSAVNRGLQ